MGATSVSSKVERVDPAQPVTGRDEDAAAPPKRLRSLRRPRRPRLWFELLLIAVSYLIYSMIRNAAPLREEQAQSHARWIWELQDSMGLAFERGLNHAIGGVTWLIIAMNYYYATLHFIVTIAVLVWLFRSHPGRYGATRLVLFATTAVALLGYYFYPLAPPRLMDGMDFIDTASVHRTWGSLSAEDSAMASVSNQYAAMPSMHIGWSVWCGITIAVLARPLWLKLLGALYPALTLLVIMATANHFWLDAAGGVVCLAFGYGVAYLWYGGVCYRLPRQVPGTPGAPDDGDRASGGPPSRGRPSRDQPS
ncbi:phosphatase PAP2 family protein [Streptomyces sp. SBT349]|uniref:phosphatase PAP2 family protein n=1 Tax=Streptomyces sp. SBT349 TaxID=1580539 RepID=UPI0007C6BF8F|nr:phosphatase PAP2 family protein [Streptomyces sp. SBT349]